MTVSLICNSNFNLEVVYTSETPRLFYSLRNPSPPSSIPFNDLPDVHSDYQPSPPSHFSHRSAPRLLDLRIQRCAVDRRDADCQTLLVSGLICDSALVQIDNLAWLGLLSGWGRTKDGVRLDLARGG
jgi:hypothetical protein